MSGPSATALSANSWMWAFLNGTPTPGTIPRGGMKGFKRETGWDEKKGKGTKGATLTLTSEPPVKGTIHLQLIGPGGLYAFGGSQPTTDFAQWDNFVSRVLSIPAAQQKAQGLSWYYPGTAAIGLTTVVVKHYGGPEYIGKGLYICEIQLIEWTPPPPASIVATVASKKGDAYTDRPGPNDPKPVDPRIEALQAQIKQASAANQVASHRKTQAR